MLIFAFQELSVFGPYHVKLSVTSHQVGWHELLTIATCKTDNNSDCNKLVTTKQFVIIV